MAIGFHIHEQLGGMQQLTYVIISFNDVGIFFVVSVTQLNSFCHGMNLWYQVSPYCVFCFSSDNLHLLSQPQPWARDQSKGLQGCRPRRKPRSHTTCSESVRKCEGMNPHTLKGASTLGVGVPVDSQIFKRRLQGPKLNGLRSFLYHWKTLGT